LRCRPLAETVTDTWQWMAAGGSAIAHERAGELGLDASKENEILEAWSRPERG
jgi:2'-hydroxyisoflavone reductase